MSGIKAKQILVVGCSSSEVVGERIGSFSSVEVAVPVRLFSNKIGEAHLVCAEQELSLSVGHQQPMTKLECNGTKLRGLTRGREANLAKMRT